MLCYEKALERPLLYLSLYFKTHRDQYYGLLQQVRMEGDWEAWLDFFLEGVAVTAEGATQTAQRVFQLGLSDRRRVEEKASISTLRLYQWIQTRPVFTISEATQTLGVTHPTVARSIRQLQSIGLVAEISGRARGQVFAYNALLHLLSEGTDPLP